MVALLVDSWRFFPQLKDMENRRTIAAAFQRHIDEHHGADFEVCADPECQRAVALERDIVYPD